MPDSQLIDRALEALLHEETIEQERRALTAHPYETGPALTWAAPPGPALPYDGDVPDAVIKLAAERRAQYDEF